MDAEHEDYEQTEVLALLSAIKVADLRVRISGRPTVVFVTVAVDGEQQFQSDVISDSVAPTWMFPDPCKLCVFPSSSIKFTVYRRRCMDVIGDKLIGVFEAPLYVFINEGNVAHELRTKESYFKREKGSISVQLHMDAMQAPNPEIDAFEVASHRLERAYNTHIWGTREIKPAPHLSSSLYPVTSGLDHLVIMVNAVAEVHPDFRGAWILFLAVRKSIERRHELDDLARNFILDMQSVLSHVQQYYHEPEAMGVVRCLAKLVAEGATLLDEYLKRSSPVRTILANWGSVERRIRDCQSRLEMLRGEGLPTVAPSTHQNYSARSHWQPQPLMLCGQGSALRIPSRLPPAYALADSKTSYMESPQPFPTPMLYPDDTHLTDSPGANEKQRELPPETLSTLVPSTPAPSFVHEYFMDEPRSRHDVTEEMDSTPADNLEELRHIFPGLDDLFLEIALDFADDSINRTVEMLRRTNRSELSLPDARYPIPDQPTTSPLRFSCNEPQSRTVSPHPEPLDTLSAAQSSAHDSGHDTSLMSTAALLDGKYTLSQGADDNCITWSQRSLSMDSELLGNCSGFIGGFCIPILVANRMRGSGESQGRKPHRPFVRPKRASE